MLKDFMDSFSSRQGLESHLREFDFFGFEPMVSERPERTGSMVFENVTAKILGELCI
jgi:hypothetical protein